MASAGGHGPARGVSNHNNPQTTITTAPKMATITRGMFHGQFGGIGVTARKSITAEIRKLATVTGLTNR